jgi:hypothetical protein
MANHAHAMEMRAMERPSVSLGWVMSGGLAEIGGPMRHHPPEKRADMPPTHRSRQGSRQHKFHKPGADPRSGLVQLRAQSNGFVVTHPFAAPFIVRRQNQRIVRLGGIPTEPTPPQ